MLLGDQIKIMSANCQGLRDKLKRTDVLNYFNHFSPNIICLQDTHLTNKEVNEIRSLSGYDCYISGKKTNSRGVAILIRGNFEYKIHNVENDSNGNFLLIDLDIASISVR